MPDYPWIVTSNNDTSCVTVCYRCTASVSVTWPVKVMTYLAITTIFEREHAKCEEVARPVAVGLGATA